MRRRSLPWGAALTATMLAACVAAGGAKHFKEGERLRVAGDFTAAEREYNEALAAEPKNERYRDRLATLRAQMDHEVERLRAEARSREKAGDWAGAAQLYAQALGHRPNDKELLARKELSSAKAKNLDPDAWYEQVLQIAAKIPGNKIVERSLAGAKANAYQYHLTLAARLVDSGDGTGAIRSYDRARQIDPSTPAWDRDKYEHAQALDLAAQADLRLVAGEAVDAHQLYERAYQIRPLPEIKKKLAEAKARASAILKKLDAARAKAAQGRHAEALRMYDELITMRGVPMSVSDEAAKVRGELSRASALEAERHASRGDLKRARASLLDAIKAADLGVGPGETLKISMELTIADEPGKALATIDGSGVPAGHPVESAARAFARSGAKASFTRARSLSSKEPSKALAILAALAPFEKDMPEIVVLKQSLRKDAFAGMLDDALLAAGNGEERRAGELLLSALKASKAPPEMRTPAEEGARFVSELKYLEAEKAFSRALVAAPKSVLAQTGLEVARLMKRSREREALDALKSGKGPLEAAVATLQASREAEPGSAAAADGAKILLSRLETSGMAMDDAKLAEQIAFAARLIELPRAARDAIEEANARLAAAQYPEAEAGYKRAESVAPGARLPAIARNLGKSRMLAALKPGANGAGDEASAKALAKLLKADPDNRDAQAALRGLLEKAEESGSQGKDGEAARYLTLVVVATEPAPGLKVALDKGNKALGAGDMTTAEKFYADALDLEGDNAAAKLGLSLARAARVAGLKQAVSKAKEGGGTEQAQEALRRTLELDPNSAEARQAFGELLDGAKAHGAEGRDREAASLLDTANVVSKPETTRKAIGDANRLLADGKHVEAEAAYTKITKSGASRVAETGREIARQRQVQVLSAGVAELQSGGDLDRGAKATRELLALDATNAVARGAIDAALGRAEEAAARGDAKAAARELRAADIALGTTSGAPKAISDLDRGKLDDAEAGFARLSGEVASRGVEVAKRLKAAALKEGMSGDSAQAGKSIREVLATDPGNKDAQIAFDRLLERAKTSAKKGDDREAATALESSIAASGAPDDLAATLKIGVTHLSESRHAEAEAAFGTALEINRDSKVAITGRDVARDRRKQAEKSALDAINKGADPIKPAQVLEASLIVEPSSKPAAEALSKLLARAKKSASRGELGDAGRALEAAAMLEGLSAAVVKKIGAASVALSGGELAEAEAAYDGALSGGDEGEPVRSQAASLGRSISRERRLVQLKGDLAKAQKDKDSVLSSSLVQQILAIDPDDKAAKALFKKVGADVAGERYQAAVAQKGYGKLGLAHVYLTRVLALDPEHKQARAELESVETELKRASHLIVKVQPVTRAKSVQGCKGFDEALREAVMSVASEREDLGMYVLGKEYTDAVERGEADAPKVSGELQLVLGACQHGSSTGKMSAEWTLLAPEKGKAVAKGKLDAELPAGLVPRDEQDGAGENARRALSKRAAAALLGRLEAARDEIDAWRVVAAEHAMSSKDTATVADHFARLVVTKSRTADTKRLEAIEKYLEAEVK